MSLTLHYHPLSSFCWKVLIALYENGTAFTPKLVDLSDERQREALRALWPIGKFPVLEDGARGQTIPESTVIIEYLDRHYPGPAPLIPADPDAARETRLRDRFFDLHLHMEMQKVVGDRLRPADSKDPFGVAQARAKMATALGMVETAMAGQQWAMGEAFTLADCAAAPALYYADRVMPFGRDLPNASAYLARLMERPSFARTLKEAEPYFSMFPQA
jgi:glutathione S-transferase